MINYEYGSNKILINEAGDYKVCRSLATQRSRAGARSYNEFSTRIGHMQKWYIYISRCGMDCLGNTSQLLVVNGYKCIQKFYESITISKDIYFSPLPDSLCIYILTFYDFTNNVTKTY